MEPDNLALDVLETISIKNFSWHKGGFQNVMILTATGENKGQRTVKYIKITCTHSAKSCTVIDRNRQTIFETI